MENAEFWSDFRARSDELAGLMDADSVNEAFEAIDNMLSTHNLPFCFDITMGEECPLLIFSPEGDRREAMKIDELLRNAPHCGSWRFFGRRQKKHLDDAAAIVQELYYRDPRLMTYGLRKSGSGWLLTMQVPSASDMAPEVAQGMVNTFLWHAVGEGAVMDNGIIGRVVLSDTASSENTLNAEGAVARMDEIERQRIAGGA